ncbi:MAG: C39 family peptidase [Candidatus Iainarchaeum archaeon]|uniref:C39 family peptidase n=1 Tax=Candidatus Iainarchaeum sp. TaxID=3101447 RepID=A0A7T9DJR2_9ARCH|nr:MAG: C39 family peptidase [Candidatus Diapherotrites archaeon]
MAPSSVSDKVLIPDVPYYMMPQDDPGHCYQVSMKVVLEYFLHKQFPLEELDRLTGRKGDFWTWGAQVVSALDELGLRVKYYSSADIAPFMEGADYMRRAYPNAAEKAISKTDMPVMIRATKNVVGSGLFEIRKLSTSDICDHLRQGNLVIVNLDLNVLYRKPGAYGGHSIVVVGYDADAMYVHESNFYYQSPYKRVLKADFEAARAAEGIDFDVIVVYGPRAT